LLRKLQPDAFERLSQRILREAGFIKVEVTGRSGDGGIDGIGVLRVNLLSFHVLFQCKRYQSSVGASAIRDFRGAMVGRSDKGLIITTGTFTPDAKREATRDGAPAIDLIDGDLLCDLLKDLKLGVRTEMVEQITVDPTWFADL
jgi:restriction system protein